MFMVLCTIEYSFELYIWKYMGMDYKYGMEIWNFKIGFSSFQDVKVMERINPKSPFSLFLLISDIFYWLFILQLCRTELVDVQFVSKMFF